MMIIYVTTLVIGLSGRGFGRKLTVQSEAQMTFKKARRAAIA